MENTRYSNLKKSFVIGVRSLLSSCSREKFGETFPNFAPAEVERLHQLYFEVITCLTESIEDEFESLCEETQAGTTLNMVEELVEEQRLEGSLNPLFLERSNTEEVMRHYLSEAKKDEISYLMAMLEKAEEQKRAVTSLLEAVKKERHDFSGVKDIVNKTGNFVSDSVEDQTEQVG
ncbi:uncharacterized protein LOC107767832 isoform X2 [Nicotiana tabacum]|uniref:Uncharacterized protein LOC107767832 isoform X2 n=1 Tax=Nicotiana tabacum TaxID=4097 RepID=A0AC58T1W7_TOBAC|nr:uncharacterized protein LOC104118086 isoform X1 [Nicotiana tomentosiformis]